MLPLRRTCKQAAALIVAREDRPLALTDRVALRLHLAACRACPLFEHQILVLRQAMGCWRHYAEARDGEG